MALNDSLTIHGIRIAYSEFVPGFIRSAVPIVFLHDSLGSVSVWKDFPRVLSEAAGLKAIAYDRQGYGASDPFTTAMRDTTYLEEQADFLIAFLDALAINQGILFGHSDGGSIALIAAARYPERIKAVITEGAHVFVEEVTLQGIRDAKEAYRNTDLRLKLERHHGDKVEALFRAWTETWLMPEFRDWNIAHLLERITCPVLTIYGANDEYGSLRQPEAIAARVRGHSEKAIIPGIGHSPHKEAREETLELAGCFMKSLIY